MKFIGIYAPFPSILLFLITILLFMETAVGEARARTVELLCGNQWQQNSTVSVPNFVGTMEKVNAEMQATGVGQALTGTGPDANYGFGQCYGDLSLTDCQLCYAEARTVFPQCFPHNGARIFLDGCFLRSENYSFYSEYKGPGDKIICGNSTRKNSTFQESARRVVLQAASAAPLNNGYARAEAVVPVARNESAYVLANCWRSLNATSCRECLRNASTSMLKCLPWSEGRALYTGCFMMYSNINFLNPIPGNGDSRGTKVTIISVVVSSVVVIAASLAFGLYVRKQRKVQYKRSGKRDAEKMVKILRDSSLNFKFSTLDKATGSFSDANKLGQGGFGTVYKGVLPDGREIAVKRLFFNNKHRAADFYNEVNLISSVEHKNLVRLLGCSCSGPESLLVYEYLHNQSLDHFIFDGDRGKTLNWDKRYEIIVGSAEGLVYLHENSTFKIIHRDIKAGNILLDSRYRAKIADFGLARSFDEDQSHITTGIAGTLGYMAPEYLAHGQLTDKADVYSFGVLLLEIVTGKPNNRAQASDFPESLVITVWKQFQEQTADELIDPNVLLHNHQDDRIKKECLRVMHIGLLCGQEIPSLRPTMSSLLRMLTKKDEILAAPTNPPFVDEQTMELNDSSEDPSNPLNITASDSTSIADVSHSIFLPR